MTDPELKTQTLASMDKFAMPPNAIARAIAFAIEQPLDVHVGQIIGERPVQPS
jgi:NADP-dependent 3-hydroxy acid dehydrogenase YdfG